MALSTAPSEPLDAVAEVADEAGDSSGSGRSSPGAGASVSPFSATAFALEAMPPAETFRYPYGRAPPEGPGPRNGQAGDCCDESVQARGGLIWLFC